MIPRVVFKWPEVRACPLDVTLELSVSFSVVLDKRLVAFSKGGRTKILTELCDAKKKFSRWITCKRRGKVIYVDLALAELFLDLLLQCW